MSSRWAYARFERPSSFVSNWEPDCSVETVMPASNDGLDRACGESLCDQQGVARLLHQSELRRFRLATFFGCAVLLSAAGKNFHLPSKAYIIAATTAVILISVTCWAAFGMRYESNSIDCV